MRLECIQFTRCCFCIPLRHGLLVTGYLKLVLCAIMLWGVVFQIINFAWTFQNSGKPLTSYIPTVTAVAIMTLIILLDGSLTIVFIVGGHKKDPHLMKVYYYYSIVIFVLFLLAFVLLEGIEIYTYVYRHGIRLAALILKESVLSGFTNLGFQVYMILLTRSEIVKLENNCTFRFVNNAAEGECTMVNELNEDGTCVQTSEPVVDVIVTNEKSSEEVDTLQTVNENDKNDKAKKNGNYVKLV